MNFEEILGQEEPLKHLTEALNRDSLPHALLFYGPDGVGKRLTSLAVAKTLNCQNSDAPDLFYCDKCASCENINKMIHPDLQFLKPDGNSITIDSIRNLLNQINLTPYIGRNKVAIIDEAHTMTTQSANALLKTLEEPPQKTCIILITPAPGLLPITLRSRCHTVVFKPLSPEIIHSIISHTISGDKESLRILSMLADGSAARAATFNDPEITSLRSKFLQVLDNREYNTKKFSLFSDKQMENKEFIIKTIYIFKAVILDMLFEKFSIIKKVRNIDLAGEIRKTASSIDKLRLWNIIHSLEFFEHMMKKNANKRLAQNILILSLTRENFNLG